MPIRGWSRSLVDTVIRLVVSYRPMKWIIHGEPQSPGIFSKWRVILQDEILSYTWTPYRSLRPPGSLRWLQHLINQCGCGSFLKIWRVGSREYSSPSVADSWRQFLIYTTRQANWWSASTAKVYMTAGADQEMRSPYPPAISSLALGFYSSKHTRRSHT